LEEIRHQKHPEKSSAVIDAAEGTKQTFPLSNSHVPATLDRSDAAHGATLIKSTKEIKDD
jgi:hypothetical protein